MKKWTRRAFIGTGILAGGAVAFGVAIRPGSRADKVADIVGGPEETLFNVWLKISTDNIVTAIVPHVEMGQGVHTALAMMLAEELDADWEKVRFEEAPIDDEYANPFFVQGFIAGGASFPGLLKGTMDGLFLMGAKYAKLQLTGGSGSVRFTGNIGMRLAGATAREMLVSAASKAWNVPEDEVTTEKSHLYHKQSERSAPYSEFASEAVKLSIPSSPKLKSFKDFQIIGTSPQRFDIPEKVNGKAGFGIDVKLPDMKYATVKAAPVFGSKITSMDSAEAEKMPGVHKVLNLGDAVAVVADGYWLAKNALASVKVEFEEGERSKINQEDIYAQYRADLDQAAAEGKFEEDIKKGNANKVMEAASKVLEAEYTLPFLAHTTMEPLNCTAWIHDGICELWLGTQNGLRNQYDIAELLGMKPEQVKVHNQLLGGGFGRRGENDVPRQAAKIAKEVSFPVKMIWSREEDVRHDVYREAGISRIKAGLNADKRPLAWTQEFVIKHHPVEASHLPYDIENQLINFFPSETHVPWGNWRSVDHSVHAFYMESFMDELAHAAAQDPLTYRKDLLASKPRFQKVLDAVAEMSGWGNELAENRGRGVAIHEAMGSIVAEVVEVKISDEGELKVDKVYCVADAGFAVHPDAFIAQMESGIVYGLSAALTGEITIQNGAVQQSNFHDYPALRMKEMPKIETFIINSEEAMGGAGEPSTPPIAPAVCNAIFDLTGIRVRSLPIKNHDLSKQNWV